MREGIILMVGVEEGLTVEVAGGEVGAGGLTVGEPCVGVAVAGSTVEGTLQAASRLMIRASRRTFAAAVFFQFVILISFLQK